jgi:hypothetical protein
MNHPKLIQAKVSEFLGLDHQGWKGYEPAIHNLTEGE